MKKLTFTLSLLLSLALIFTIGCKKNKDNPDPNFTEFATGYFGTDDMSTVPATTNFGFGADNLPASYSLIDKFPPIGDQGSYGTCVAWAVGYNMKTAINGMEKSFGAGELANPANQSSPKDLFIAVDDGNKGDNCGGTNFNFALDIVQNRGVASLQTVPYSNLGNCSKANQDASWAQEAANNKIKYWRKVDGSIEAIKKNVSQNVPVVFGAKLADNFMAHNSDEVITSATSYDNVGQHAYHAMIIAGYDDNKGPNGAFRIINSWGQGWGATGLAWIDYNFFFSEFVMGDGSDKTLFMAANESGNDNPPDDNDPPDATGVDLIPWVFEDIAYQVDTYTQRRAEFNIYNVGDQTAPSSANWSFYYIYFNAYDANDYGIIFYDEFNTSVPADDVQCDGNHCVLNIPIASGNDLAYYLFGDVSVYQYYDMPTITGYYYLLAAADAGDVFQEQDEINNLFYPYLWPVYFENGVGEYKSSGNNAFQFENDIPFSVENIKKSKYNSIVNEENRNAYTSEEIIEFLKKEKRSGRLDKKIQSYIDEKGTSIQAK
jgi:C1A family cysteine protease